MLFQSNKLSVIADSTTDKPGRNQKLFYKINLCNTSSYTDISIPLIWGKKKKKRILIIKSKILEGKPSLLINHKWFKIIGSFKKIISLKDKWNTISIISKMPKSFQCVSLFTGLEKKTPTKWKDINWKKENALD